MQIYSSRFNRSNTTERNARHLKQLLSSVLIALLNLIVLGWKIILTLATKCDNLSSIAAAHVPLRDKGGVIYRRLYEQTFKQYAWRDSFLRSIDIKGKGRNFVALATGLTNIDRLILTFCHAIILPSTCFLDTIGLFSRARLFAALEMFIAGQ